MSSHRGPVRDPNVCWIGTAGVMVVRREEVEARSLEAEGLIGQTTFADEDDLRTATEGVDDRSPLFQRRVIGDLVHVMDET
jgi:hypothetical protein